MHSYRSLSNLIGNRIFDSYTNGLCNHNINVIGCIAEHNFPETGKGNSLSIQLFEVKNVTSTYVLMAFRCHCSFGVLLMKNC